jgi:hypothetical protein
MGRNEKGIPEVADFSSPSGEMDAKIRIYGLVEFMYKRKWLGIVPYNQDSLEIRERTVAIARFFVINNTPLPAYNIVTWNCETFVLVCKTANVDEMSEQGIRLLEVMKILPTAIAEGCQIM